MSLRADLERCHFCAVYIAGHLSGNGTGISPKRLVIRVQNKQKWIARGESDLLSVDIRIFERVLTRDRRERVVRFRPFRIRLQHPTLALSRHEKRRTRIS